MCGRFTLRTPAKDLAEFFRFLPAFAMKPRYNIAPTQPVLAIRRSDAQREGVLLHWGLIPSWSKDPAMGGRMINARAETVASKPSFRGAFRSRRCLIPADGFYEWQKTGSRTKQPFFIHMRDERPFAFAGLWEKWARDGSTAVESCTIITTEANPLLKPLHDRMPVILDESDYDCWLDSKEHDKDALEALLVPYAGGEIETYAIGTLVNSPRNDTPECVQPVDPD